MNARDFSTVFWFDVSQAQTDGFTFVIQNAPGGPGAIGAADGSLGYAGIPKSVAVKFDFHDNAGEGSSSTGLYVNGAAPPVPARPTVNLGASGIDSGRGPEWAKLDYDGTTLSLTLTDTTERIQDMASWTINIPDVVGSDTAYVGFTAGTGALPP